MSFPVPNYLSWKFCQVFRPFVLLIVLGQMCPDANRNKHLKIFHLKASESAWRLPLTHNVPHASRQPPVSFAPGPLQAADEAAGVIKQYCLLLKQCKRNHVNRKGLPTDLRRPLSHPCIRHSFLKPLYFLLAPSNQQKAKLQLYGPGRLPALTAVLTITPFPFNCCAVVTQNICHN